MIQSLSKRLNKIFISLIINIKANFKDDFC